MSRQLHIESQNRHPVLLVKVPNKVYRIQGTPLQNYRDQVLHISLVVDWTILYKSQYIKVVHKQPNLAKKQPARYSQSKVIVVRSKMYLTRVHPPLELQSSRGQEATFGQNELFNLVWGQKNVVCHYNKLKVLVQHPIYVLLPIACLDANYIFCYSLRRFICAKQARTTCRQFQFFAITHAFSCIFLTGRFVESSKLG